jgi:hypothetical protein
MLFLFLITLTCFCLAVIIDKFSNFLPKIIYDHDYSLTRKFSELGIFFSFIFFTILLIGEEVIQQLPILDELKSFWPWLILLYVVVGISTAIHQGKQLNWSIQIDEIEDSREHPSLFLQYALIRYEHGLIKKEQGLSLLKALSPIPFLLLLTDSISFLLESMINAVDKSYSEYLNIGAILFLFLYLYITYKQYSSYQETLYQIQIIKRKLYLLEHPNLMKKKKDY